MNNVAWTIDIAIFFRSEANNNDNKIYVFYLFYPQALGTPRGPNGKFVNLRGAEWKRIN